MLLQVPCRVPEILKLPQRNRATWLSVQGTDALKVSCRRCCYKHVVRCMPHLFLDVYVQANKPTTPWD